MPTPITVTTLNNQIKSLLETHYQSVYVTGEVSRVTYHGSGHIYFSLKDENSTVSCVMFKGNNRSLKFRLEEGMSVVCFGGVSVYTPRGSYQLNIMTIEPEGSGALAIAFEQLKKKLEEKGWFEKSIKKSLPPYPKTVALVTSKTGAALQDMLRVAKKRYPLVKFVIIDTVVQGEGSADKIAQNITLADKLNSDVIIVARGGGSLEDLWSFNEETVAEAIFKAKTPVVSAIGHEIDFLISDFVADKRASTPSNAIEIVLPDKTELLLSLDNIWDMFNSSLENILYKKHTQLSHLKELYHQNSIEQKLLNQKEMIKSVEENLYLTMELIFKRKENHLNSIKENLEQNNPAYHDKKGYAQIVKNGEKVDLEELETGDIINMISTHNKIEAKVISNQKVS